MNLAVKRGISFVRLREKERKPAKTKISSGREKNKKVADGACRWMSGVQEEGPTVRDTEQTDLE